MPRSDADELILPARWNRRFMSWFFWYTRRLFAKKFHAVLMERASVDVSASLEESPGPLIIVMNHCAWWDVLVFVCLHGMFASTRRVIAPMDRAQLKRFSIFRRMGVFGIDPDDPSSLPAMIRYVDGEVRVDSRALILLNPQGKFVDVRSTIEVRPGAAMIASRHPGVRVVAVAVEYGFWTDAKPEVFLRMREVAPPVDPSTPGWQRAIIQAMQLNATELASCVMTRDPSVFERIAGKGVAQINPIYDLWLRVTGRGVAIDLSNRRLNRVDLSPRDST